MTPRADRPPYRGDIDGLRAVAIGVVVLFHAGVPWFSGGFVGVDVFFVISGFLITSLMLVEVDSTGRFSLGSFVARRVRRLLPMAVLVLAATVAAGAVLVAPLARDRLFGDARAALLYFANWRFAGQSTAYTDTDVTDSLLLHYWSLSVEEQFYVVWPVLFAIVVALTTRYAPHRRRGAILAVLTVGVVVSFGASASSTAAAGYYWTHLRLWQMGAGALVAFAMSPKSSLSVSLPRRWSAVAAATGLAVIVAAALLVDESTRWPGTWALVPTMGTVLIIVSGGRGSTVHDALGSRLPVAIGRNSYGWYLWHWPAIGIAILWNRRGGGPLDENLVKALAAAGSLALAVVTRRLVEDPVRHARGLASRRASLTLGGAAMVLPLLTLGVVAGSVDTGGDTVVRVVDAGDIRADGGDGPGPPRAADAAAATAGPIPQRPDGPFAMTPRDAADDRDACGHLDWSGDEPQWCELGDPDGSVVVAVIGDSHALNWQQALAGIARARSWRLISSTKSACAPYIGLPPQWNSGLREPYRDCAAWARNVMDDLAEIEPDLVVFTHISFHAVGLLDEQGREVDDADPASADLWSAASRATYERLLDVAGDVVVILDTPRSVSVDPDGTRHDVDVPECLSANLADPSACSFAVTPLAGLDRIIDAAASTSGLAVIDGADIVCPGGRCAAVTAAGIVTYKDVHHLTDTYSAWLAPDLAVAIDEALVAAPPR
ncbi:MAG: acyltransferase family protein [Acidimicrobiales bacterium]